MPRRPRSSAVGRLHRFIRRGGRWAVLLGLAFYGVCSLSLVYVKFFVPFSTSVQVQRRIESLFTPGHYVKRSSFVPLQQMSVHLVHAAVAAEDARFFQHRGIDWIELKKVLAAAWRHGRFRRGASTITQQLMKNLFLTTYAAFPRKVAEFSLVPLAELLLSKERILELYLNVIEWGSGVYGAEAAAQYYYGISAAHLSREQAARLVACLPAPRIRLPHRMDEASQHILVRMRRMGW